MFNRAFDEEFFQLIRTEEVQLSVRLYAPN